MDENQQETKSRVLALFQEPKDLLHQIGANRNKKYCSLLINFNDTRVRAGLAEKSNECDFEHAHQSDHLLGDKGHFQCTTQVQNT